MGAIYMSKPLNFDTINLTKWYKIIPYNRLLHIWNRAE